MLKTILINFLSELENAAGDKKTSLPFIVHELSPASFVKNNNSFLSLVIGGTFGKATILKKEKHKVRILSVKEKQISFLNEKVFFDFINNQLPDNVGIVALNFAYPIKPVLKGGKLDGILLTTMKEAKFHKLIGKQIGKEIENYIFKKRNKKIKVAVANDTVCLLLSGLSQFKKEELAAGVVGTGFNIAFFLEGNRLVNLESANFDKFSQTEEGEIIDKESDRPGKALFEKEISGAYLYKHFNLAIKKQNIEYPTLSSTEELSEVSKKNIPLVSGIAKDIIKRSAQLVACQIAGVVMFKKRNMVFNMEGSLFWKAHNYKKIVEETVRMLLPKYKARFIEIQNSAILGAAKLVS